MIIMIILGGLIILDEEYETFIVEGRLIKMKKLPKIERYVPKKKESKKVLLSEREELMQRLDNINSKQYNYSSKKTQKQIRAESMSENLGRYVR